jgi:hypothetical protein
MQDLTPYNRTTVNAKRWLIYSAIVAVALTVATTLVVRQLQPRLHRDIERVLSERLDSVVLLRSLDLALWPTPTLIGEGLTIRHHGRGDLPPLIAIRRFSGSASWLGLFERHLTEVTLEGLELTIPPKRRADMPSLGASSPEPDAGEWTAPNFAIDRLYATDARLSVMPREADKDPRVFDIFALEMLAVTLLEPSSFSASLTNPVPEGYIETTGRFGPWNRDEPSGTPLDGRFTFAADLGTVKGIAGRVDASGAFDGVIDHISVHGTTTTPDFRIPRLKATPLPVATRFEALVDGTNGDVQLQAVDFTLGASTFRASGFVVGTKGIKGKRVLLDVTSLAARMEDVLALSVRTRPPAMTGRLRLKSSFDLPREGGDVLDRLLLAGEVTVEQARFTTDTVQEKVDDLSRRARGRPEDTTIDEVPSTIRFRYTLRDGRVTIRGATYQVRGARIAIGGQYALESGALDFTGTARLDASASDTQTGLKHFLLKPLDPLFRKGGAGTRLAMKVSGTVDAPEIGIDLGRTLKGK